MQNNRVLIIDDDKSIAEYFQAVLSLAGLEVEIVLSAREGLVRLAGSSPGLILLDMRLGNEIGGEDILYQIRSNPRLDHTRVIVITAYPSTVQMVSDLADLVLIKPVGVDQLTELAKRMMTWEVAPKVISFRDPITGLFNLEFFYTRLELAFERAKRRQDFVYAVISFQISLCEQETGLAKSDVDASNLLLVEIARRLKNNLRPTDTLARVSGYRFVTLHEDLREKTDVSIIVDRIQNILTAPFYASNDYYKVNVTYGTAVARPTYQAPRDIFTAASLSLEQVLAAAPALLD